MVQLPILLIVIGTIFLLSLRLVAVVARERRLERTRLQQMTDLERFQTPVVRSVSHDPRTPLTSARLYADVLIDAVNKSDAASIARAGRGLESSIRRLERIVERTTDYAAIGSSVPIETSPIDVGRVAESAVARFQGETEDLQRQIKLEIAPEPPQAIGNATRWSGFCSCCWTTRQSTRRPVAK